MLENIGFWLLLIRDGIMLKEDIIFVTFWKMNIEIEILISKNLKNLENWIELTKKNFLRNNKKGLIWLHCKIINKKK